MVEAIAETFHVVEVRAKVQFLALEAESSQVVPFPGEDAKAVSKAI